MYIKYSKNFLSSLRVDGFDNLPSIQGIDIIGTSTLSYLNFFLCFKIKSNRPSLLTQTGASRVNKHT